jgi:hypothetical protein
MLLDAEALQTCGTVRMIFQRFIRIGSATKLVRALRTEGTCGKQGKLVDKGYVYKLLNNRVYVGERFTRARLIGASTKPSSSVRFGTGVRHSA